MINKNNLNNRLQANNNQLSKSRQLMNKNAKVPNSKNYISLNI